MKAAATAQERERQRANARRAAARHYAVQALYQCQYGDFSVAALAGQFKQFAGFANADADYFAALVQSAVKDPEGLDACYAPFLGDRTAAQLDPVCRALMRMATAELLERPETPTPVVIAEAVRLARRFCDEGVCRFVNGALAEAQSHLRPGPSER